MGGGKEREGAVGNLKYEYGGAEVEGWVGECVAYADNHDAVAAGAHAARHSVGGAQRDAGGWTLPSQHAAAYTQSPKP